MWCVCSVEHGFGWKFVGFEEPNDTNIHIIHNLHEYIVEYICIFGMDVQTDVFEYNQKPAADIYVEWIRSGCY